MIKWEYARLESRATGVNVVFTHRPPWTGLAPDAFFDTLRRLGDDGWELVAALPLAADITPVTTSASSPGSHALPGSPERHDPRDPRLRDPRDWSDPRGLHDPRDPREPHVAREPAPPGGSTPLTLQIGTDRWLLFKRPQPTPEKPGSQQADLVKGLVQTQLLKGRLPLP